MSFCIRAFRVFAFFSLFLCICVFLCLWFCVRNTRQHISLQRNVGKQPLHKKVLMDGKNSWARQKSCFTTKTISGRKRRRREMRDKKSICHRLPPDIRHLLPPDVHFKEICVSLSHFCVLCFYVCVFLWSCLSLKDFSQCTKLQRTVYAVKALYIM